MGGGYCLSGLWRISLPCSGDRAGLPVGVPSVCSLPRFLSPSLLPSCKADSGCGVPSYTSDPLWGPLMHLSPYVGPPCVPLAFHGAPLCTFGFLWGPLVHLWPSVRSLDAPLTLLRTCGKDRPPGSYRGVLPVKVLCLNHTYRAPLPRGHMFISYLWSRQYPDHTC